MAERAAKTIDERFDEVSQAFREQRDFTVFCFEKLRREVRQDIRASEGRLTRRLESMDRRFTHHELLLTEILNEVKKR